MTITLTKPETAVVWRSADSGSKVTRIPRAADNNGYELVVKTTLANGDLHTVQPTSGTIGGAHDFRMVDNGGSVHLLSDGNFNDWVVVCACGNHVIKSPPPGPFKFLYIRDRDADSAATTDPSPGPIKSTITWSYTIHKADEFGNIVLPTKVLLFIYTECLPPPTPAAPAPSVVSVVDDHGLTWHFRSAHTAFLPATGLLTVGRDQFIRFETWWVDSTSLIDGDVLNITITLSSDSFVPHINLYSAFHAGDWDASVDLPASLVSTTGNNLPSFQVGTTGQISEFILYYMTPNRALAPLSSQALLLLINPVFSGLFEFSVGTAFFNLNQASVLDIKVNSAGSVTFSANGLGTTVRSSTATPPLWFDVGFGSFVSNLTIFITDSTGTHFFICNQAGITGMSEPLWNTTTLGSNTADGTVIWTYLGTSFFIAPYYTSTPSWTEPFIGGDHFIPTGGGCAVTDSARAHEFNPVTPGPGAGGRTGLTEPVWDTSAIGAHTIDGTVVWRYAGPYSDPGGQELLVVLDAIDRN